jgi:tRNA-(ms[2]io[6]A)-hydroxylase
MPMPETPSLPLLSTTPRRWAELAAANLPIFLADHAVCEQQAALTALTLLGQYPDDVELVERMSALAIEEVAHFRRVTELLHRRGLRTATRRSNTWVKALRSHIESTGEPGLKIDRLLAFALIEARSCERFQRLREVVADDEVAALLDDLAPAEERHWRLFHRLAARDMTPDALEARWRRWLEIERELTAAGGTAPTVHG